MRNCSSKREKRNAEEKVKVPNYSHYPRYSGQGGDKAALPSRPSRTRVYCIRVTQCRPDTTLENSTMRCSESNRTSVPPVHHHNFLPTHPTSPLMMAVTTTTTRRKGECNGTVNELDDDLSTRDFKFVDHSGPFEHG